MGTTIKRDFDKEILKCLGENSFGLTITEIADSIKTTRNTVYRYIIGLEGKDLVFKKKVGNYVLYFSKEKGMRFSDDIMPIYKGFISILKEEFPGNERKFKEIGKKLESKITSPVIMEGFEKLEALKKVANKKLFETIRKILPYANLFDNKINARIIDFNEEKAQATFLITNSTMLNNSLTYEYHFFILAGFLEEKLKKVLGKNVNIELIGTQTFENPEDNYIKFSIEIG